MIGGDGTGIQPTEEEKKIVATGQMAGELGGEPGKTLQDARFVIGDYISCAIIAPLSDGSVAPNGAGVSAGVGQENGSGGFRVRGAARAGPAGQGFPPGEWRRGEVPGQRGR